MKRQLHWILPAFILLLSVIAPARAQICPTAPAGTSNNQCASTAFVATAVAGVSGITGLTGDGTATGPGSVALTLATVNSNVGTFGSASAIPSFTVNGKGLITAVTTNAVTAPAGTLTGATLASNVLASSLTSVGTLTGGATGAGFTLNFGASTLTGRVAFANVPQGGAFTFAGNPTGSTADLQAFTVASLTNKAIPTGSDLIIIADAAASNATKYCTLTQCLGAITSGVSSIDAKTGAFTSSNGIDTTAGNVIELTAARRTLPTTQSLTSGTAATYTTPSNTLWIEVFQCGGGGGGAGVTNAGAGSLVAGSDGGTTSFNSINAAPGKGAGADSSGGAGGTGGTGTATRRAPGGAGAGSANVNTLASLAGAVGGSSYCGGGASGPKGGANANGNAAGANTGAGGSGAVGGGTSFATGGAGGAGEFAYQLINSPSGTYTYTIGASGAGGAGVNETGGNGGTGFIFVIEHYGS